MLNKDFEVTVKLDTKKVMSELSEVLSEVEQLNFVVSLIEDWDESTINSLESYIENM